MLVQTMTRSECVRILTRTEFGRLACARENQPYVVPIYFIYDEPHLYSFTTLGQKVEWMRSNPLVCVELDEVVDRENWTSIVIFGHYEELPAPEWEQEQLHADEPCRRTDRSTLISSPERLHADTLLQKHAEWWEPACASCTYRNPERPLIPVFYRIRIDRITGRRAKRDASVPGTSRKPFHAGESPGWLRRILHPFSKLPEGNG